MTQGTLIRVYNTHTLQQLLELRRGAVNAHIYWSAHLHLPRHMHTQTPVNLVHANGRRQGRRWLFPVHVHTLSLVELYWLALNALLSWQWFMYMCTFHWKNTVYVWYKLPTHPHMHPSMHTYKVSMHYSHCVCFLSAMNWGSFSTMWWILYPKLVCLVVCGLPESISWGVFFRRL